MYVISSLGNRSNRFSSPEFVEPEEPAGYGDLANRVGLLGMVL